MKETIDTVIDEMLNWHPTDLRMASVKHFVETGKVSGEFRIVISEIAKTFSTLKRIKEKIEENKKSL